MISSQWIWGIWMYLDKPAITFLPSFIILKRASSGKGKELAKKAMDSAMKLFQRGNCRADVGMLSYQKRSTNA